MTAQERELFRSLMLTLPDGMFFDIIRNHLGRIKTPFHKPDLLEKLITYFLRDKTRRRILDVLDKRDIRFISAVLFLGNPEPKQLFSLLEETDDRFTVHHHIMNLEYRLVLMTDSSGNNTIIRCNPLIEKLLLENAYDLSSLFPSSPLTESTGTEDALPWLQEAGVAAFLSYIAENPESLRTDGSFKKRQERELRDLFPSLFDSTPLGRKIDLLFRTSLTNGLIRKGETKLDIDWQHAAAFSKLDKPDRLLYFWSGIDLKSPLPLQRKASFFKKLIFALPEKKAFPKPSLRRFIDAYTIRESGMSGLQDFYIESLISLGIIRKAAAGFYRTSRLYTEQGGTEHGRRRENALIIQQNMQVTVKPETDFAEALRIAQAAQIRKYDILSEYEISKRSFTRYLQSGGDKHSLFRDSAAVPRTVSLLLDEWESDFNKIQIFDGTVLSVDEALRHFIDHTPGMSDYIIANPAPGVYVLKREDFKKWRELLLDAGLEQIPPSLYQRSSRQGEYLQGGYLRPRPKPPVPLPRTEEAVTLIKQEPSHNSFVSLRDELYHRVEEMSFSKEMESELKARIDNRLILFPENIQSDPALEPKTAEAKGIDFIGKVRLIEQALGSGRDILELIERTASGDPRRSIVSPKKLDRSRNDLYLIGRELPDGGEVEIPVKKLSLVRKFESALFPT